MAHEFESGFFVRQPAWHGLGNVLAEVPNTEAAFAASGLDWEVERMPLFAKFGDTEIPTGTFGLFRNTDRRFFAAFKEGYTVYQNREAFEWTRPLVESGLWTYEAAGALRGGAIGWTLLKFGETELVKGDMLKQYLLQTWSHDGSVAVSAMPTTVRVVCKNTLTAALSEKEFRYKVKHTASIIPKMEEVRQIFEAAAASFKRQKDVFAAMIETKVDEVGISDFVYDLVGTTPEILEKMKDGRGKTVAEKQIGMYFDAIANGSGLNHPDLKNTAYALYQGAEEAIEHFLGGDRVKDRGIPY